jgi:elongation factor Ts
MMVEISASMVKELREKSGAAMMDCKKALVEASGDFEKAFEWLRQKGISVAGKKATRMASEGLVTGQVSQDGKHGVLLEINCETDFVARNEQFVDVAKRINEIALQSNASNQAELVEISGPEGSVKDMLTEAIAKTGENIVVRRFASLRLGSLDGVIGLYLHALGGKMGAVVKLESTKPVNQDDLANLAREIAMHVVSAKPQYIAKADVPQEVIDNERRIEAGKTDLADKKPEIREKIVSGRVDKIFAERCLLEQPFVKDPSLTVGAYISAKASELGLELRPTQFSLFILGEVVAPSNGQAETI